MNIFNLKNKTALVTGSSRGIGKAIAMLLGEAGAKVWFHASRESAKLDSAISEAKEKGIDCEKVAADISTVDGVESLIASTKNIDILVLNASVQAYVSIETFNAEEFEREYNTNVRSTFQLIQAYLPEMKEKKFGRIITIGSVNQWKQSPGLTIYASTKSAVVNLTQNLARSCAPYGITVNNVAPGVINTDRNEEVLSNPDTVKAILSKIPAGRIGIAEDIAGTVLLLASDAGSYITGTDIPVAGGMQL